MPDQYIAIEVIEYDGARAHSPGDVVPAENVKRNGWGASVAKQGTKAANAALGLDDEAPPSK